MFSKRVVIFTVYVVAVVSYAIIALRKEIIAYYTHSKEIMELTAKFAGTSPEEYYTKSVILGILMLGLFVLAEWAKRE